MRKNGLSLGICFVGLALFGPAMLRGDTIAVTEDTYLDSRAGSTGTNYGTRTGLKVFANEITPDPTHVLIALPNTLAATPAGHLTSVKLWLYNSGTMPLTRPVELHPLTRSFTETGATWGAYDGVNGWSTPGGDYSAAHVDVSAADNGRWYAFDITSMLKDSNRADLVGHGLLLKLFDDATAPAATTGLNFVSSENTDAVHRPYFEVAAVPEPSACAMLLTGLAAAAFAWRRKVRASAAR
jgi:hypothetical protein